MKYRTLGTAELLAGKKVCDADGCDRYAKVSVVTQPVPSFTYLCFDHADRFEDDQIDRANAAYEMAMDAAEREGVSL